VIDRLLAEPQRYEFFQAVRLLLRWLEGQGIPARHALLSHLRFPNDASFRFPPGQIAALEREAAPGSAAPRFRLTPTFMGLLGAHGALPWHDTERIVAHEGRTGDAAARAFLDIFSTRLLALFYEAWTKYRLDHLAGRPPDASPPRPLPLLPMLLALAGIGPGIPHDGVGEATLGLHAGLLRGGPLSAAMLARLLAGRLRVPVTVAPGAGHWDRLAPPERTALAGANATLGGTALLGERCWRPDLRVRVRLGPLTRAQFERFLPGAPGARTLNTLLGLFGAATLSYEIELGLRRGELAPLRLGEGGAPARLGLDSYLLIRPSTVDRADLRYLLRPLAPLPPLPPLPPSA
jgi:type VI secretion system protein ImpH